MTITLNHKSPKRLDSIFIKGIRQHRQLNIKGLFQFYLKGSDEAQHSINTVKEFLHAQDGK